MKKTIVWERNGFWEKEQILFNPPCVIYYTFFVPF
jgi:hypothetical protein